MTEILSLLFYNPIYNTLIGFYNTIAFTDFGVAIILTTVALKLILYPLYNKQIDSQKKMQDLQPEIKKLQKKHEKDKERQAKELMKFYKEKQLNPFGGCLPLIVQIVFFFAIYRVISNIEIANLNVDGDILYSFITNPGSVNPYFFTLVDLSQSNILLAVVTALAQYYQTKMLLDTKEKDKKEKITPSERKDSAEPDMSQMMMKQMLYLGPILTFGIGVTFASGLMLYWLTSTVFMIVQQKIFLSRKSRIN